MHEGKAKLLACGTIVKEIRSLFPEHIQLITLGAGLHKNPESMSGILQKAINTHTAQGETLFLGYGLCSMGVLGLSSAKGHLAIPRVEDCICLLLGSTERYRQIVAEEPGTYFLSKGWIESRITLADSYRSMVQEYGENMAQRIQGRMLKNYKRLIYVEMGHGDEERYGTVAKEMAQLFKLRFETIQGNSGFGSLIGNMATGHWDERFIVLSPGETLSLEAFQGD